MANEKVAAHIVARWLMLGIEEWRAELQRLETERAALEEVYGTLKARLTDLAHESNAGKPPTGNRGDDALMLDLLATVETDRQHIRALWRLLADALQRNFREINYESAQPRGTIGPVADSPGRSV